MNLRELFKNGSGDSLPEPTVTQRMSGDDGPWTPDQVRGIRSNPCYAGIGPYPALVPDVDWVHAAAKAIKDEGAEQFLVNVLAMLRASFESAELNFGGDGEEGEECEEEPNWKNHTCPDGYEEKFSTLMKAITDCKKNKVETMVVAWPWVLGDTYQEIVETLSRIAEAGMTVAVTGRYVHKETE